MTTILTGYLDTGNATNSAHVLLGTVPNDMAHGTNHSAHNVFCAIGGTRANAEFGWRGHTYHGFVAYRHATGQHRHSRFR